MTGDTQDIYNRLRGNIPPWFGDDATINPVIPALLWGIATVLAFAYALIQYARLQTRILTATDGWLDLIAADFFGSGLPRKEGQSDAGYRAAIIARIFREKGTRKAIHDLLFQITGHEPRIIEPTLPSDCGGYGVPSTGYGVCGAWGSLKLPYTAFVEAYLPMEDGVPMVAGYGIPVGGYGMGAIMWADSSKLHALGFQDIYDAIEAVKPYGTTVWTAVKVIP